MAVNVFLLSQALVRRLIVLFAVLLICVYAWIALSRFIKLEEGGSLSRFQHKFPHNELITSTTDGPHKQADNIKKKAALPESKDPHKEIGSSDEDLSQDEYSPGQTLIKRMMKNAWDAYKNYAWGQDELRPVSKGGMGFLGSHSMMLTAVDALDTLMVMHMDQEYLEARDLVLDKLSFDVPVKINFFETNIRIMGGLLGAFALSGDARYVTKVFELAQRYLAAFENGQVVPSNDLDLMGHTNNATKEPDLRPDRVVTLAQIGTFSLEFAYLSDVLNDPSYVQKTTAIIERMSKWKTGLEGLYPASIYPNKEVQPDDYYSLGGLCDSFYEYLLKYWLYTGKRDQLHHDMYRRAVAGIKRHLIQKKNGHYFLVNYKTDRVIEEQEHLACFIPGMLALGAVAEEDQETLQLAEALTESCYLMYHKQKIGLSPEFIDINNFQPVPQKSHWVMRPEVVESIFIMWRITKNPKYRKWGLNIAQAIEKYAKVETGGYSGIEDISVEPPKKNDHQESFFLAETLKYLYLLFASSDVLPLDEWVFNTEAHPFPINWRGSPYSSGKKDVATSDLDDINVKPSPSSKTEAERLVRRLVSEAQNALEDFKKAA